MYSVCSSPRPGSWNAVPASSPTGHVPFPVRNVNVSEGFDSGSGDQYFSATYQVGLLGLMSANITLLVTMEVCVYYIVYIQQAWL